MEDKRRQSFLDLLSDITRLWKVEIYACGLEKTSSVSSAYLRMKARVTEEWRLVRGVRRIEEALLKSKKADLTLFIVFWCCFVENFV